MCMGFSKKMTTEEILFATQPAAASQIGKIVAGLCLLFGGVYLGITTDSRWLLAIPAGGILVTISWYNVASMKYVLTTERFLNRVGLFSVTFQEIELFRVKDFIVAQSFMDRLFNVGNISILSEDKSTPAIYLYGLENPVGWKEVMRQATIRARKYHQLRPLEVL